MKKKMFSIIVPIYKVEKYIRTCIDSVLKQQECSFELILVDDGSPDNCGDICEEYSKKDDRIKVIHKKNGGLSSARNAGIEIASGNYIIFLDSDDFWDDTSALLNIRKRLDETDADLLVFPAKRYYEDGGSYTYILNEKIERNKIIDLDRYCSVRYMLEHNVYRAAAWNKVIKKSVIDEHGMRFKEGYLSEDMDWCGDLLIHCRRFDFYENPFYAYRQQRSGSITAGKTEKLVSDKLYMCKKGLAQIQSLKEAERELIGSYYAYEYAVLLGVSYGIKDKSLIKEMKQVQSLLDYSICDKVKKVNKAKSVLGFEMTRYLLCLFVKIKR